MKSSSARRSHSRLAPVSRPSRRQPLQPNQPCRASIRFVLVGLLPTGKLPKIAQGLCGTLVGTIRPGMESGKGSSLRSPMTTELMGKRPALPSQAPTRGRFGAGGVGSSWCHHTNRKHVPRCPPDPEVVPISAHSLSKLRNVEKLVLPQRPEARSSHPFYSPRAHGVQRCNKQSNPPSNLRASCGGPR